jgi:hypothetical protein
MSGASSPASCALPQIRGVLIGRLFGFFEDYAAEPCENRRKNRQRRVPSAHPNDAMHAKKFA